MPFVEITERFCAEAHDVLNYGDEHQGRANNGEVGGGD
jgi:hypothetical protein